MQIPLLPRLGSALQRLSDGRSEAEVTAIILLEYLRSDGCDSGVFFDDTQASSLATVLRFDVVPRLEDAGVVVAFCDVNDAGTVGPVTLVREGLAGLAGGTLPPVREITGTQGRGRPGAYAIDDEEMGVARTMVTTAVEQSLSDFVLIIAAVERLLADIDGRSLLAGIQGARGYMRAKEGSRKNFLLVGVGTDEAD